MAEYSIVQDFNNYNSNLHNTIKMNQVLLNKESIFLIRDTITDFSESISTKNILTLEKINGKSFDTDIIGKITSQGSGINTLQSQVSTAKQDIINLGSSINLTNTNVADLNTKTDDNNNRINLQTNDLGTQNNTITAIGDSTTDNSNSITALIFTVNKIINIINKVPGNNIPKI